MADSSVRSTVTSTRSRAWPTDDVEAAQLLANISSAYIANAASYSDQRLLTQQLQRALDSRILIEEAKGMITAATGLTVSEAFGVLRSYARSHKMRIRDVAAAVVAGTSELIDAIDLREATAGNSPDAGRGMPTT